MSLPFTPATSVVLAATDADADADSNIQTPNSDADAGAEAEAEAEADDSHVNQQVDAGANEQAVAVAANEQAGAVAVPRHGQSKEFIKIQNDKKSVMFKNLLQRCDNVAQSRALASKHGVPQAEKGRKHSAANLLLLLGSHRVCTDFCLISAHDASSHGIHDAELFSARELRASTNTLSPRALKRASTSSATDTSRKRRRTTATESREAAPPAMPDDWPSLMTWSQKKELMQRSFTRMEELSAPRAVCSFCGTKSLLTTTKEYLFSELDVSLLEEAVCHIRQTLSQPAVCAYDEPGQDATFRACPACARCVRDNVFVTVPLFSYANGCWIGAVPEQLNGLSYVESMAIARARGTRAFVKLDKGPTGQSAALGNVCILPQEPRRLSSILPPPIHELADEIAVVFVSDASSPIKEETLLRSPLLVRRSRIMAALKWLQENNPLYSDIEVSADTAMTYPEHGVLPTPTQHMIGTASLRTEGASYTSYSGQANLEAFEGDEGSVPILSQAVMDLDNVGTTFHERKLQAILRLKQGKDSFIKYPSGSTPLSTAYTTKTWCYLWPTLFPYGVGAFEDGIRLDSAFGLRKLHFKTHIKHVLNLEDTRFCTHPAFIFIVMNVLQRRASSFSATLATKRTWFPSVQSDLESMSVEFIEALQNKLEREPGYIPVAPQEKTCLGLLKKLRFLSEPVAGSAGEIAAYREEIRAVCRTHGLPHLYITLNPADVHHPLAQIIAGRQVELMPTDDAIDSAERQARARALASNPVAGAKFFHHMMTSFLDIMVGTPSSSGVFGPAAAHYGIVEAQDRGSLHCHMFVWLENGLSPNAIKVKAGTDMEWSQRYLRWLEDIVKMDFPELPANNPERTALYTANPTMALGPSPEDVDFDVIWPHYLDALLRRTGQNHDHGPTCYKHLPRSIQALRDSDKDCRFRLPRPNIATSSFDEDGHIELKCSNGMMNGYNDIVASTTACNMDCKAIGSGTAAMAMIHYVTNYISKLGFDDSLVMSALAGSMKAMERNAVTERVPEGPESDVMPLQPSSASDASGTRLLMLKTVNQMIGKRKLSGQQVSAFLCGFPNRYTSLKFENVFWGSLLRRVLPEFYRSYLEVAEGADDEDSTEIQTLVPIRDDTATPKSMPLCSAFAEDYAWRHRSLQGLCFWDFLSTYVRKRKSKKANGVEVSADDADLSQLPSDEHDAGPEGHVTVDDVESDAGEEEFDTGDDFLPFRPGHVYSLSHGLRRRKHIVVPVLIGPNVPRRDTEGEMDKYHATMLLLFKPWQMTETITFKDDGESWKDAFDLFSSGADDRIKTLMDNMQQLHECKDARDDHSAQRKAREALLRGRMQTSGYDDAPTGDDCDDEIWLAAMREQVTSQEVEENGAVALGNAITQRAIDHATAAGFYDASHNGVPSPSPNVKEGDVAEEERALARMCGLMKEKDNFLVARKNGTANGTASASFLRNSVRTSDTGEPAVTTWARELDLIRQKYSNTRFGGTPWRRLKEYQKHCIALVELYTLNAEQAMAFVLICNADATFNEPGQHVPLQLLIGGPGGTGKSQIFSAVQHFMELQGKANRLKLTAPTGVAASNIGGSTIHSEASLRVPRASLRKETNRMALEERWRSVTTCVVDEISFLGANDMALLNEYLKLAKPDANPVGFFGGLNIVFVGDMAQLPPPMSRPLFDSHLIAMKDVNGGNDAEKRALGGIAAYRSVARAVVLKTVMRQTDPVFVALLGRLRYGMCTGEDKVLLDQYVLGSGSRADAKNIDASLWLNVDDDASPLISYRNGVRDAHNVRMAESFAALSEQEHWVYHSLDKIGKGHSQRVLRHAAAEAAWSVPPKHASDLHGKLPLLVGMPVFCTENIATELGISNGSEGRVASIAFFEKGGLRFLISADVDFPAYLSTDANAPFPHRVVLTPVKANVKYSLPGSLKMYSATRWQLPLIPAFAYTCHNSQGRSLTRATVDLTSACDAKDKTPLAYVMLSRVRSLEGLTILRPFPMSVISTHASAQVRTELKRIDALAAETVSWAEDELDWYYNRVSTS